MNSTTSKAYNESSFEVLEGLQPVRQVPGMYTRTKNPLHITQEVLDNAIDEAQNGHASKVSLTLQANGYIAIEDNGRGIPVGLHPTQHVPVVVLAYTKLHAGAKFSKGASYGRSGGLHGVGVSVTNALSHDMTVTVRRDGAVHEVTFVDGDKEISPVRKIGVCASSDTGTHVRFKPNAQYFESSSLPIAELLHLLRCKAMLLPGLTVAFHNEVSGEHKEWCYAEGLREYLAELLAGYELVGLPYCDSNHLTTSNVGDDAAVGDGASWAVAWTAEHGRGESYVNLIPTPQGGTHEAGLKNGLFEALRDYCDHHRLLPKGVTLQAEDLWSRTHFALSASVLDPEFQGQTKDKLTNRDVVKSVATVVKAPFMKWLLTNMDAAKQIADLAIKQATARLAAGKVVEKRKSSGVATLPGKLTDCRSHDTSRNEVLLVEGDSAGGGCKTARDRETQAVLPLRGKVLNTWEVARTGLFANNEVHDISVALGVDPHSNDADDSVLSGLRYGKVIILSDADVDGAHIQVLLLTLFYKHFPRLVERGHVYIAKPPLYRVDLPAQGRRKPAQKIYCLTEAERDGAISKAIREGVPQSAIAVARFKGLGEMNNDQLKSTVLDPDTRTLLAITVNDAAAADALLQMLMAKGESQARRTWLELTGNQAEADA